MSFLVFFFLSVNNSSSLDYGNTGNLQFGFSSTLHHIYILFQFHAFLTELPLCFISIERDVSAQFKINWICLSFLSFKIVQSRGVQ